jgi:hypothetical protein
MTAVSSAKVPQIRRDTTWTRDSLANAGVALPGELDRGLADVRRRRDTKRGLTASASAGPGLRR